MSLLAKKSNIEGITFKIFRSNILGLDATRPTNIFFADVNLPGLGSRALLASHF